MSGSFDRRSFLRTTAAAGAAMGLGSLPHSAALAVEKGEPLFKISLAEWSFHRALSSGKMDNLDFPLVAKQRFRHRLRRVRQSVLHG